MRSTSDDKRETLTHKVSKDLDNRDKYGLHQRKRKIGHACLVRCLEEPVEKPGTLPGLAHLACQQWEASPR